MFPPFHQLVNALHRSRKPPLPPEKVAAAEERSWHAVQQRLTQQTAMTEAQSPPRKLFFAPLLAFSLVLLLAAGAYLANRQATNPPAPVQTASGNRLTDLFTQASSFGNGKREQLSYGYVRSPVAAASGIAHAAEGGILPPEYHPALFYQKEIAGDFHGRSDIYSVDLVSKKVTRLTTAGVNESMTYPFFSSVRQLLAYTHSTDDNPAALDIQGGNPMTSCSVDIRDIRAGKIITTIRNGKDCYSTMGWSPDGRYLLLEHVPAGKEKVSGAYAFYDSQTGTTKDLPAPSGLRSDFEVQWLNSSSFTDIFVSDDLSKQELLKTDLKRPADQPSMVEGTFKAAAYKVLGSQIVYQPLNGTAANPLPALIVKGIGAASEKTLEGTENSSDFLMKPGFDGRLSSVVFSTADEPVYSRLQDTSIADYSIASGTIRQVLKTSGGFMEGFIGFYTDYERALYLSLPATNGNGSSPSLLDVHLLNLTTGSDEILFSGIGI